MFFTGWRLRKCHRHEREHTSYPGTRERPKTIFSFNPPAGFYFKKTCYVVLRGRIDLRIKK